MYVLFLVKDYFRNPHLIELLTKLCLFDSNGNVILFASATTFLGFSLGANYGILLYSGAPVFEAPLIDFYARRSEQWFQVRFN